MAAKKKRQRKCSSCSRAGHDARTCPKTTGVHALTAQQRKHERAFSAAAKAAVLENIRALAAVLPMEDVRALAAELAARPDAAAKAAAKVARGKLKQRADVAREFVRRAAR